MYCLYGSPNFSMHHLSSERIIQCAEIWNAKMIANSAIDCVNNAMPIKQIKYAMYIGLRENR